MFGSISLHVIAVASLTVMVKGVASGVTFALPISVTLPVLNVNWFPVTVALAAALITTPPVAKVNPLPATVTLAAALITILPVTDVKVIAVPDPPVPAVSASNAPFKVVVATPDTFPP